MKLRLSLALILLFFCYSPESVAQQHKKTVVKKTKKPNIKKTTAKKTRRIRKVKKPRPSLAQRIKIISEGEVKIESRIFKDDDKAYTKDTNLGLFTRLKLKAKHGQNWQENIRLIARADKYDPSRAVFFFEEGYIQYKSGDFEFSLGAHMFNWSATEAFHPADTVNSRNFDSNLENAEKIGEPMLLMNYLGEESKYSVFIMPMLVKPILPQYTNRLSLSGGFPMAQPLFIKKDGSVAESEFEFQYGARFEHSFDDSDISLHYLDHLDRSTPFVTVSAQGVLPLYLPVQEIGGTFQMVADSWVYKLAAAFRDFKEVINPVYGVLKMPDHTQVAFGIEYGWSSDNGSDTTLILEGQSLFGTEEDERAAINIFQRDLLFGYRYAFNDINGKELFASIIYDIERSSEMLINLNFQRRISSIWKMSTGIRIIDAKPKEATPVGLELLDGANQVYFDLTRYF